MENAIRREGEKAKAIKTIKPYCLGTYQDRFRVNGQDLRLFFVDNHNLGQELRNVFVTRVDFFVVCWW